jgi:hypothetical protein
MRPVPPLPPQNTIETHCGVSIDYQMLTKEMFAAGYPKSETCKGFCNHDIMRKLTICAALDNVTVKGRAGQEYFAEYDIDGNICDPILMSGRGITISRGVKRPVITNHVVSVCCMQLFMYIMICRRAG